MRRARGLEIAKPYRVLLKKSQLCNTFIVVWTSYYSVSKKLIANHACVAKGITLVVKNICYYRAKIANIEYLRFIIFQPTVEILNPIYILFDNTAVLHTNMFIT